MKDALDQLLYEVRRDRRIQARAKREERSRLRHRIPDPEAQGKPERWKPSVTVLIVHSNGVQLGLFLEFHHELHPEWTRYQPATAENSPHHTLVVSGRGWFSPERVDRPDSDQDTIALRERFIELLNGTQTQHNPLEEVDPDDSGGSAGEAGPLSLLAG